MKLKIAPTPCRTHISAVTRTWSSFMSFCRRSSISWDPDSTPTITRRSPNRTAFAKRSSPSRLVGAERRRPRDWQLTVQELFGQRVDPRGVGEERLVLEREVLHGVAVMQLCDFFADAFRREPQSQPRANTAGSAQNAQRKRQPCDKM